MQAPRVLRPLGLLEIVDQVFRLYRESFWLLVGIAGLVYIPMGLLQAIPDVGVFVGLGFLLLGLPLAGGATVYAVSERYQGRPVTLEGSYRVMVRRLFWLYLTAMLVYVLYAIPVGVPSIPGIIAIVRLVGAANQVPGESDLALLGVGSLLFLVSALIGLLLLPWLPFTLGACVLEAKNHARAITRATFLLLPWVWGVVLGVTVIMFLLTLILRWVLTLPTQIVLLVMIQRGAIEQGQWHPLLLLNGLLIGVAGAVCFPLMVGAYVLLYYDSKIRKEGYDLQLLAQGLEASVLAEPALSGSAPPTAAAPPAEPADTPWRNPSLAELEPAAPPAPSPEAPPADD